MIKKINLGLALSRNYDKVSIELVDEPIECVDIKDFQEKSLDLLQKLREVVNKEFENIGLERRAGAEMKRT